MAMQASASRTRAGGGSARRRGAGAPAATVMRATRSRGVRGVAAKMSGSGETGGANGKRCDVQFSRGVSNLQRKLKRDRSAAVRFFTIFALALIIGGLGSPQTNAQGSRRDDVVFGSTGHPIAGATVTVCQAAATGTPCAPLATLYTDATLTTTAANPFQADGIGNYHFYAPAGRYLKQISGPQITGTLNYPDVILPADVSSSGAGNNISAFGLTLGGNLSVAANATISGTLTTTNFNPGTFTPSTLSVLGNETVTGPRPRVDVTAFGAKGDGVTDDTAAIRAAITAVCNSYPQANAGGSIFFPSGVYVLTQPQLPSTAAIFPLPCPGLHFVGGNGTISSTGGCPVQSRAASATGGEQRGLESEWRGRIFDDVSGGPDYV
jgi:hypothetical protein